MTFEGRVQFRSSRRPDIPGPPGEAQIQALNPQRLDRIRAVTGRSRLASGSLNLAVDDSVIEGLGQLSPTLEESAQEIAYPAGWRHIPVMREAYWYYAGTASVGHGKEPVLIRRAKVPVPGVVELFSQESLTRLFNLCEGEVLVVNVQAPGK